MSTAKGPSIRLTLTVAHMAVSQNSGTKGSPNIGKLPFLFGTKTQNHKT